jgi:hypothetical protein
VLAHRAGVLGEYVHLHVLVRGRASADQAGALLLCGESWCSPRLRSESKEKCSFERVGWA